MFRIILSIILLGGGVSLIRSTVGQGTDFLVFWKTGRALLEGVSFYDLARDGGMTFKYPPWIAPFFIPFSLFSFEVGKWMWGFFSTACLFGIFHLLVRRIRISFLIVSLLAIFYWGLWAIQALDGQVVVPMLFFTLLLVTTENPGILLKGAVPIFLSAKIFTEIPVLMRWREFFQKRVLLIGILSVALLTGLSAERSFHGNLTGMLHAWSTAAQSGGTYLDPGQTHGPKNQSLSILLCQLFGISANRADLEVWISFLLYLVFFASQWKKFKTLDRVSVWLSSLAVVPVFHPLPWHHLYVFSFPLSAVFFKNWKKLKRTHQVLGTLGVALIALSAKRAWVFGLGELLENSKGRAWGALILVLVFLNAKKSSKVTL